MSRSYRVFVSGSVQEKNFGVTVNGIRYNEEEVMQKLASRIEYYLKAQNGKFVVFLNEKDWTLSKIVEISNTLVVDLHIAFHTDAGVPSAEGTTSFYHNGSEDGKKIAGLLYKEVAPLIPGKDRGVKPDTDLYQSGLYELRNTKSPSALIECGFHTNQIEATAIVISLNDNSLPKAAAKAICEYFGEIFIDPDLVVKPTKVDWKTEGLQYLIDKGYITSTHSATEPVDLGTLGTIIKRMEVK